MKVPLYLHQRHRGLVCESKNNLTYHKAHETLEYQIAGNTKLSCLLNMIHLITNTTARLQLLYVLENKTEAVFFYLIAAQKSIIPL
jgi:hypothetical protein